MIRFFLTLLILQISLLGVVSCTTEETDSDQPASGGEATSGAIDEAQLSAAGGDKASGGGEESLETDLDNADAPAALVEPEKTAEPLAELESPAPPPEDKAEAELSEKDFDDPPAAVEAAPADTPTPFVEAAPVAPVQVQAPELAKIRDIRYLSNSNGGTVVIETTKPVVYKTRMNASTQQFIVEIADVELPASLQRPYNMKEFGSRFGSINAYQGAGSKTARVVVQLTAGSGEPIVEQEGTSLVLVPPAARVAPVAAREATPQPVGSDTSAMHENSLSAKSLDEFLTGNQKFYGRAISLQVKDADIRDVINFLAEESGANIVMSDNVSGKISLKLRRIPWDQALVTVMRSRSLGYVRQGNVLRISTLKSLESEADISSKIIEAQKNIVPAIVQVIPVSYSSLEELLKSVAPFLSKDGKVVSDKRSSTLIVTDKGEVVDRVNKLIKTLDIPPMQVSIESKIVEAVENFENFIGVQWGANGSPVHLSPGAGAEGAPIDLSGSFSSNPLSASFASAQPFRLNMNVGVLDVFGNLTATLALAEHDSLAKVISAPRISTINREKSTIIQQGENVAILSNITPGSLVVQKTEKRTQFSLELSVTPQITADGGVIMDLEVKREFLGAVVDQETQSRPVNSRKATTKVLVRNGQTAVIGGIYTNEELEATNGVPGLMSIPILGWLFKNRTVTRAKNELLIFMTPRILSADSMTGHETSAN